MGLMGRILGAGRAAEQIGSAVGGVAEVFVGNQAERDAAAHERTKAALEQFAGETGQGSSRFDGFVDGLNRLPRPMLALGTLGLFGYAMAEPVGFARRMEGLGLVPDPLWWLLGAIVSFYFGARELHYHRERTPRKVPPKPQRVPQPVPQPTPPSAPPREAAPETPPVATPAERPVVAVSSDDPDYNAAVEEWRRTAA